MSDAQEFCEDEVAEFQPFSPVPEAYFSAFESFVRTTMSEERNPGDTDGFAADEEDFFDRRALRDMLNFLEEVEAMKSDPEENPNEEVRSETPQSGAASLPDGLSPKDEVPVGTEQNKSLTEAYRASGKSGRHSRRRSVLRGFKKSFKTPAALGSRFSASKGGKR